MKVLSQLNALLINTWFTYFKLCNVLIPRASSTSLMLKRCINSREAFHFDGAIYNYHYDHNVLILATKEKKKIRVIICLFSNLHPSRCLSQVPH